MLYIFYTEFTNFFLNNVFFLLRTFTIIQEKTFKNNNKNKNYINQLLSQLLLKHRHTDTDTHTQTQTHTQISIIIVIIIIIIIIIIKAITTSLPKE